MICYPSARPLSRSPRPIKSLELSANIGVFAVLVDAIDEKAKSFYEKYGFVPFVGHSLTLFLPLTTIKAALG